MEYELIIIICSLSPLVLIIACCAFGAWFGRIKSRTDILPRYNNLIRILKLPKNIQEFNCVGNKITKIEQLPKNLQIFTCAYNRITKIENLPKNLQKFNCTGNKITKIKNLPNSLHTFGCSINDIKKIENLPDSLHTFTCDRNMITKIENLPDSLHTFICCSNWITKIENLPNSLHTFNCDCNMITKIENLPIALQTFNYDYNYDHWQKNPIKYVDDIPIDSINFTLKGYQAIKRIQKRMKRRYIRNKAAIVIQKYCHNWLWSPKCKDGSTCINIRLSLKELKIRTPSIGNFTENN